MTRDIALGFFENRQSREHEKTLEKGVSSQSSEAAEMRRPNSETKAAFEVSTGSLISMGMKATCVWYAAMHIFCRLVNRRLFS